MLKCDVEGFGLVNFGICSYSVLYTQDDFKLDGLALVTFGFLHSLTDNWTPAPEPYPSVWVETDDC